MKLRTRITVSIVTLLASALLISSWKNITVCRETLQEYSLSETMAQAEPLMEKIYYMFASSEQQSSPDLTLIEWSMMHYEFSQLAHKQGKADEYVLQQEDTIIYNNSGINVQEALLRANPKTAISKRSREELYELSNNPQFLSCILSLYGKDYCIVGNIFDIEGRVYTAAYVNDITEHMELVRQMTLRYIRISLAVTILTAILVISILNHVLHPIQTLQKKAADISNGNYQARIKLPEKLRWKRNNTWKTDELTALSMSFNEMAEAVELHINEVETQSEQRKMLISALSHEMRTPVTSITGYSYLLLHSKLTEDQQKEALFFIDTECRRLERLSSKLTQLVSVDHSEISMQRISVEQLAEAVERALNPAAQKYGITMQIKTEETAFFTGDLDLLTMLITNLFDNARKAGSRIIVISLEKNQISIRDNGNGIPREKLDKVTQPFYQGDESRNTEGFGLGLALCRKIAAVHGAALEIQSEYGIGTKVILHFTTP